MKYLDPAEFRELGYLQEVNRRFLHPLGLALEVVEYPGGVVELTGIQDHRDDPEGVAFADHPDAALQQYVSDEIYKRASARMRRFGAVVQPTTAGFVGEMVYDVHLPPTVQLFPSDPPPELPNPAPDVTTPLP